MGNRQHRSSIHILDDDSLLNVFYHCRPVLLDEDETGDDTRVLLGGKWARERWWYVLTHVCRRWRELVLASTSHLGLCLVCTHGTPVAKMLAHSPALPLIVDYVDHDREMTLQDEDGILIALGHRGRLRRIRLRLPVSNLRRLTMAMDEKFPMLEYLYIGPPTEYNTSLDFPQKFQAPHLRNLLLKFFAFPIGTPLLTTAVDIVTLSLNSIPPSAFFHPNDLLQRLFLMRQLEILGIAFQSPAPNLDSEMPLSDIPFITHVTLPNLRWFGFQGTSSYLEALLSPMDIPHLEKLQITFFNETTFVVPYLLRHMSTERFKSLTTLGAVFMRRELPCGYFPIRKLGHMPSACMLSANISTSSYRPRRRSSMFSPHYSPGCSILLFTTGSMIYHRWVTMKPDARDGTNFSCHSTM